MRSKTGFPLPDTLDFGKVTRSCVNVGLLTNHKCMQNTQKARLAPAASEISCNACHHVGMTVRFFNQQRDPRDRELNRNCFASVPSNRVSQQAGVESDPTRLLAGARLQNLGRLLLKADPAL